jgi:hypothetical protein
MPYQIPRLTLEAYEQELSSLMRLLVMDTEGDDELVQIIVFTPTRERWRLSPAELLRRGQLQEAYEASRDNFVLALKRQPENLSRSPRIHQRKTMNKGRAG